MSGFADNLLTKIHMLDIRLHSCSVRLADKTDTEALHDLRITMRTLRSLLRPLRGLPAIDLLEQALVDMGQLTNPIRELQVLVSELQQLGTNAVAAEYSQGLEPAFQQLQASTELPRLLEVLQGFPQIWRLSAREGCLKGLRRRVRRQLRRDLRKLPDQLPASLVDLHALRLKVKRLRYSSEAYPDISPLGRREFKLLRQMQNQLGDWNDCQHWLLCTATEERLVECCAGWLQRAQTSAEKAGILLERFKQNGR